MSSGLLVMAEVVRMKQKIYKKSQKLSFLTILYCSTQLAIVSKSLLYNCILGCLFYSYFRLLSWKETYVSDYHKKNITL